MSTRKHKQLKVVHTTHLSRVRVPWRHRPHAAILPGRPISNSRCRRVDSSRSTQNSSRPFGVSPKPERALHKCSTSARGYMSRPTRKVEGKLNVGARNIFIYKCTVLHKTNLLCGWTVNVLKLWTGQKSQPNQCKNNIINRMVGPTESPIDHRRTSKDRQSGDFTQSPYKR